MAKRLLLVINPNAGKMRAGATLLDIVTVFSSGGYEAVVFPTEKPGDATRKVRKSGQAYDLIVCYGGDGTLSETINGLARLERMVPFGFIPAGTANDFATTLNMPFEPKEAARKILNGRNHTLDFGGFNNKFFFYVACFGLFSNVSYTVPQEAKKAFGHFAYVMEGIKQAADIPNYRLTVEFNEKVIKDEFVFGTVTNSTSVAGMFRLDTAKVKLNDGKFELILIKNPKNPLLLSKLIMDLAKQQFDPQYVIFERTSAVKIHGDDEIAWCLDGEDGGRYNKVSVVNLNKRGIIRL